MNTCHDIIIIFFLHTFSLQESQEFKTADAMRLPLQQFHFMYCFTFTLYCTVIVARINYLSIYLSIRLMHEFSRERQPLHCDVIVGKQIIFN